MPAGRPVVRSRSYRFLLLPGCGTSFGHGSSGALPSSCPGRATAGRQQVPEPGSRQSLRSPGTSRASAPGGKGEQPASCRAFRPPPSSDGVEGTTDTGTRWSGITLKGNEAQGRHGRPPPATEVGRTGLDDGARPRSRVPPVDRESGSSGGGNGKEATAVATRYGCRRGTTLRRVRTTSPGKVDSSLAPQGVGGSTGNATNPRVGSGVQQTRNP